MKHRQPFLVLLLSLACLGLPLGAAQAAVLVVAEGLESRTTKLDVKMPGAFDADSVTLGIENNINIGSMSGGGGAGKATFKEIVLSRSFDAVSLELARLCTTGKHIDKMSVYVLGPARGTDSWEQRVQVRIDLHLVMVQDIGMEGTRGAPAETIVLQAGAMSYTLYNQGRPDRTTAPFEWSRVRNDGSVDVGR